MEEESKYQIRVIKNSTETNHMNSEELNILNLNDTSYHSYFLYLKPVSTEYAGLLVDIFPLPTAESRNSVQGSEYRRTDGCLGTRATKTLLPPPPPKKNNKTVACDRGAHKMVTKTCYILAARANLPRKSIAATESKLLKNRNLDSHLQRGQKQVQGEV